MKPVTVALFTYQQQDWVGLAIDSILPQLRYGDELIINDDSSPDQTRAIIEQRVAGYVGTATVVLLPPQPRSGLGAAINRVATLAKHSVIICAAGDDVMLPGRIEKLSLAFHEDANVKYAYTNAEVIDETGCSAGEFYSAQWAKRAENFDFNQSSWGYLGASEAWHRDLFDVFGPIPVDIVEEDHVLPLRAALLGKVAYVDFITIQYRRHSKNTWILNAESALPLVEWQRTRQEQAKRAAAVASVQMRDIRRAAELSFLTMCECGEYEMSRRELQMGLQCYVDAIAPGGLLQRWRAMSRSFKASIGMRMRVKCFFAAAFPSALRWISDRNLAASERSKRPISFSGV